MAWVKPREGYVYRNYVCRKCNLTAEFQWFRIDGKNYIKSETSRRYRCPTCFPDNVDWWGDGFLMTEQIASRLLEIQKFWDSVYDRYGTDTLTLNIYLKEKCKLNEYQSRAFNIWRQ